MPQRAVLNKFIGIFRIELRDLEEDINDLLELLEKRKASQEITNYVYMENKSFLLNEISCVKDLLDHISTVDAYRYESIEAMMADLKQNLADRIHDCAFPDAVHSLVQRKFDKVCRYVMGPEIVER